MQRSTQLVLVACPQLEEAFAAFNKDANKLQQLKQAFKVATENECTESIVYADVETLVTSMDTVMDEFGATKIHADTTTYKIWDQGGQEVHSCVLKTDGAHSLALDAILSTSILEHTTYARLCCPHSTLTHT